MNNRRVIKGFVGAVALLGAGAALAQGNVYVGGGIGRGGYDADYERAKAVVRTTGATSFNVTAHAYDTMWKAYAGYRLTPNFSIEGGYWNFGRPDMSTAITAPAVTTLNRDFRAEGIGAGAVLWLPVGSSWSGLVKAGGVRTTAKASASTPGAGLTPLPAESSTRMNALWGLGVEYKFTRAASARVEFENVRKVGDDSKFGTTDVMMWTIGANYRF